MYKFRIYQVYPKPTFKASENIGSPDQNEYILAYEGVFSADDRVDEAMETSDYNQIEKLYQKFNTEMSTNKPVSMLPSDVVELYDDKESRFYLYDITGFKLISFDKMRIREKMYTLETLKKINLRYNREHRVMQSDVDKANKYIEAIRKSRSDKKIQVGDIVEITNKHGDYYQNAHIESYDVETDRWSVCEKPYIPFVYLNENGEIRCNTSGGPWSGIPNNLLLIGKRLKTFKDFGHCGMCGGGAFDFQVEVNVWEYKEANPLYGEYSTKEWRKYYVYYCADENGNPNDGSTYRYKSDGIAFEGKRDYDAWIKTFRGVEFKGHYSNQTIVFCYRQRDHLINKDDWDKLDLPMDTRHCNGINLCKVSYDDVDHAVDVYRFSNSGTLDWRRYKAYELARGTDLRKAGF